MIFVFDRVENNVEGKKFHINPFPNKPVFLHVYSIALLKTPWEKEKLLVISNFSFFPQCSLPFWRSFHRFCQILIFLSADSFSLGESKRERVTSIFSFFHDIQRSDCTFCALCVVYSRRRGNPYENLKHCEKKKWGNDGYTVGNVQFYT